MAAARGEADGRPSGVLRVMEFVVEIGAGQESRTFLQYGDRSLYIAFFAGSAEGLDLVPAIFDAWLLFPSDLSNHIDPTSSEFNLQVARARPEQAKA